MLFIKKDFFKRTSWKEKTGLHHTTGVFTLKKQKVDILTILHGAVFHSEKI